MNPELIAMMRDQVYNIYQAATGVAFPELEPPASQTETPLEDITRAFAQLEALARTSPALAVRVPPFSFTPPLDVFADGDDVVVELAVPGVERADITVECSDAMLVVSGARRGCTGAEARIYSQGEIPRGPFYRSLPLPYPVEGEPKIELDRGLLRVRLARAAACGRSLQPQPQEVSSTIGGGA